MKFLTSGKVKDVYEVDSDTLLFKFSNRVSAYDVKFNDEIPKKGEVLSKFAEFWFETLDVPNHFVETKSDTEIIVKKMEMLPIECVVRGYFYGSMVSRWKNGEISLPKSSYRTELASKLSEPIFDPTTKSTHDVPVNRQESISQNLVTEEEFDWLSQKSIEIYNKMAYISHKAGFILADLKLEFGKLDGKITLGDSIGPDEYRLWPKDSYKVGKIQEAYDKQLLRDWLTANGYQKQFDEARQRGDELIPPNIPEEIIDKMTQRYTTAYERITGKTI
jgi:phosphoribosylaminoimidazole-succinocarboxamide synthase|tara:strand:+ start:1574 stop:2401 length:828 start_codon:yes stop_codon:yes gene_type:complete